VTTARRSAALPEVPTVAEAGTALGLSRFDISTWFGLFAPAGMSPEHTTRLNKAFVDALATTEVKARLATLMAEPAPSTPAQFTAFVQSEAQKYRAVVKATGARAD
jgi:tripartite-type tricarboxylate transporter receptor subunit TctC